MTDVHKPDVRSYNMSRIRGKNTNPELMVRKFLFSQGYRYRLHYTKLPGKPDITFTKIRFAIFIHGCFWHGHEGCKYYKVPQTRTEWWLNKIKGNRKNDENNVKELQTDNWNIFTIWECELKPEKKQQTLKRLDSKIKSYYGNSGY
jgi:DNA mismatch endonuclease (patch repair protein)